MLPAGSRLRERADFASVLRGRSGGRAGSRLLVVHAALTDARTGRPPRVGLVVSKAVGGAVVRNRTKRRLRAILASRLDGIPTGCDLVVRALPGAGTAPSRELANELDPLLRKAVRKAGVQREGGAQ